MSTNWNCDWRPRARDLNLKYGPTTYSFLKAWELLACKDRLMIARAKRAAPQGEDD